MSAAQGQGLVGSILGGAYRITRLIGQGGMGAVYEGVQLRLERRVAIKLMARELSANPEAIARFRREAEVTSQIGHPHIVQVFDFGAAPTGEPYLVMEYLEGEDLEKRIQRAGRLPLAAATHIIKQVASALSATHAKGIVHRDLKPANVFLLSVEGETDFVKVVDFGISKVRSATTKLTAALAVMGTPNYMAPEQAAGRVNDIDPRTDQWALACIGYELLAGRPPFIGEDVASLLYQVIHQAPSPLAEVSPGLRLPGAVEGVLRRALSKTQAERFPTLTEFSRAFEGAASGQAAAVAPAPPASAAIAGAPTMASSPGLAPVTTFSSAAGEASDDDIVPARPARRWLVAGVGAAVLAGGAMYALVGRHAAAPIAGPAQAGAVLPAAAAGAASAIAAHPPAAAPPLAGAPSPDAGSAQVAAAPQAPASSPKKSRHAPRPAWPPAGTSAANTPAAAAPPPADPAWPPREAPAPAAAPAWPAQRDTQPPVGIAPAWPPQRAPQTSGNARPAPAPAWPPPRDTQQPAGADPAPAWPPPSGDAPPGPTPRKRRYIRKLFE
ncbi:MAG TPA: serine/threonine-protein kinase [Polyangia bacterium]|jgi:serine/threonine-protein kinase